MFKNDENIMMMLYHFPLNNVSQALLFIYGLSIMTVIIIIDFIH